MLSEENTYLKSLPSFQSEIDNALDRFQFLLQPAFRVSCMSIYALVHKVKQIKILESFYVKAKEDIYIYIDQEIFRGLFRTLSSIYNEVF